MQHSLTQLGAAPKLIALDSETYAEIDTLYGVVNVCRGQRNGAEGDWGGQCISSLPIDFLTAIVAALPMPAEFAGALADRANGVTYVKPGIDWGAVEDDRIGD